MAAIFDSAEQVLGDDQETFQFDCIHGGSSDPQLFEKWEEGPHFQLVLNKNNSVNGTDYVQENGKLLDKFVRDMAYEVEEVPRFSLTLLEDFFREENVESLSRCWRECGGGLVELKIVFPMGGTSFSSVLPKVTFPKLSKVLVQCSNKILEDLAPGEKYLDNLAPGEKYLDNLAFTHFLNSLLADTPSLTDLVVEGVGNRLPNIPESCKHLSLPSSLTRLMLTCKIDGATLEGLFLKNALPNLKELFLVIPRTPFPDGLLFQVLDRLKGSLQNLAIGELYFNSGPSRYRTKLGLPVMKNLTKLWLSCVLCELEDGVNFLEIYLPNLECLELQHQTPPMLEKWTGNSTFPTVKTLSLWAVDENFGCRDWRHYTLNLDIPKVQQIQRAFPNVTNLQLSVSNEQTSGLKWIFLEMKQLTSLELAVAGSEPDLNSDFWDSLLTGAPVEVVAILRKKPDFWENLKLQRLPALYNLRNLKSFSLREECNTPAEYTTNPSLPPLISDLAFHFGFLKMPKWKALMLFHRFVASERMTEKWRSRGRTLVYTNWENQ